MIYKTGPSLYRAMGERERVRKRGREYFIHQFIIWPFKLHSLFMYIQEHRRDYTKAPAELMVF